MNRRDLLVATAGAAALPSAARGNPSSGVALKPPEKGPVLVAVVVGAGATLIDFAGPWEMFGGVTVPERTQADQTPFAMGMVSDKTDVLETESGLFVKPQFTYDTIPGQPNVILMGAQGEHTQAKIDWIRHASRKADLVMSVCTGAFLLAKTGLLDGLQATTHHDFYDKFEKQFPKVHLVRGPRYVDNGKIATAGGLTSGMELALHVIARYYGQGAASRTAYYEEYNRSAHRPIA